MAARAPQAMWSWTGAVAPAHGAAARAQDGFAPSVFAPASAPSLAARATFDASAMSAPAALHELRGLSMGTTWSVKLVAPVSALIGLERGIQARLAEVVAQMSTWQADSDISRYNRAAAGSAHILPAPFAEVLHAALALAADTDGAYDPTIGPLADLWGFGPAGARTQAPATAPLAQARERVDWRRLRFDPATRELSQPGGAYLDFSSIAKGYGVDRVGDWLLAQGVADWLVEVGGELRAHGRKPDGSAWRIAVERPGREDEAAAVIALDGLAIATSGDYRRYFEQSGVEPSNCGRSGAERAGTAAGGARRYSHTLDPRTGAPIDNAVASVTVLHERCMHADALATALTVLGARAGFAYANRRQLAALFVLREGNGFVARTTPGFVARQRSA
ncbi:thiamine biosynthesis lipoprotein [Lysobacter sp. yr284]|uniref:FAD:protein FMN transferase n=1 Tax=Lysobacter sp. yr284 TaxID=1761791 RepID=UPI00089635A7|nr:FAD:protein FMN transferase [Lysobacter sp. yr284]SDY70208.1 thiamine biosynthesis lipoprotein [Lysobacter sp. yr284]